MEFHVEFVHGDWHHVIILFRASSAAPDALDLRDRLKELHA
jgi:hypothetical protein